MGNGRLAGPLLPHYVPFTSTLCSGPLCGWRRSESDLWVFCHPARPVYSSMPPDNTKEAAKVFTSLDATMASSAAWPPAAAGHSCSASLLCDMHRTQLYPLLSASHSMIVKE